MKNQFQNPLTNKIVDFLSEIGIEIIPRTLDQNTFLPGIYVKNGQLLIDEEKLEFPGDLLHEAGHLAVCLPDVRKTLSDEIILPAAETLEVQSIAWSYAACIHLDIDPRIVFHEAGYKGNSEKLLLSFSLGVFLGVNGLEVYGMTFTQRTAAETGVASYPAMRKWLRE